MSPVGSAFRTRCRMFPSLVNCCTIDWFTEWPPEALLSVSETALADVDLGTDELKVCTVRHTRGVATASDSVLVCWQGKPNRHTT